MDAVDELIKVKRVVEPQEANRTVYERMYQTYRHFYSALAPIYRSSAMDA
jgi:sugar (pentulose or hexulose) kinase